jgi:hypothetical protein
VFHPIHTRNRRKMKTTKKKRSQATAKTAKGMKGLMPNGVADFGVLVVDLRSRWPTILPEWRSVTTLQIKRRIWLPAILLIKKSTPCWVVILNHRWGIRCCSCYYFDLVSKWILLIDDEIDHIVSTISVVSKLFLRIFHDPKWSYRKYRPEDYMLT